MILYFAFNVEFSSSFKSVDKSMTKANCLFRCVSELFYGLKIVLIRPVMFKRYSFYTFSPSYDFGDPR
jgi:hypothetical protein